MQIDDVIADIMTYGSLYLSNTRRADAMIPQIRARIESLIAAPAAPQQAEPTPTKRWWTDADELLLDSARDILIKSSIRVEGNEDAILRLMKATPPQQAEPVEQIGWADEFGNLFPMGAWKPAQRTHHDSHKTAWRPVFLHPPADEVQRLRDAAKDVCEWADAAQWALGNETGVPAAKLDALRRALEGGE